MARAIEERLSPVMAVLGIVFLLVVVGQMVVVGRSEAEGLFGVATWVLWAAFVGEYVLRLVIAPSTGAYLRRTWWQILLLALPFLSFVRLLVLTRLARMGRLVSSALRGTRSARQRLGGRIGWLVALHVVVVLSLSEVAFQALPFSTFGEALYRVALASMAGEPMGLEDSLARTLDVLLAAYSVLVFATLAGILGSYFLERRAEQEGPIRRREGPPLGASERGSVG